MTSKTSISITNNSNGSPTFHETNYILVEIVSALNVPIVDYSKEPDPFVVVEIGGKLIHQTDVLYDQEFPIWSLECGSLFLVDVTSRDKYVRFSLKEYETWRRDPTLGTLDISIEEMKYGKGDRLEFPMIVPQHVADLTKSVKTTIVRKVRYCRIRGLFRSKSMGNKEMTLTCIQFLCFHPDTAGAAVQASRPRRCGIHKKTSKTESWNIFQRNLLTTGRICTSTHSRKKSRSNAPYRRMEKEFTIWGCSSQAIGRPTPGPADGRGNETLPRMD
jgi:C2 domain